MKREGNIDENRVFDRLLLWTRRVWQAGLLLRVMLAAAGALALAAAAYGVLDFFLAFSPAALTAINVAIVAIGAVWLLVRLFLEVIRSSRETAHRVDALLEDGRQGVLTAWELRCERPDTSSSGVSTELHAFLVRRCVVAAIGRLRALPVMRMFPRREVGRQLRVMGVQLAVVAVVVLANAGASFTILSRILHPTRDIPPYSRYNFQLHPETLTVMYGGDLEISADIDGPPVRGPVWLLTRYAGRTHRVACFQEEGRRYAQRLTKVVYPIECCFAVGRARGWWHTVHVRLQPKIASARLTVAPPAYSRLPQRSFAAGRESLKGLRKSRIRLDVTSNRPLLDGTLSIRPRDALASPHTVEGTRSAPQAVTFEWELDEAADIEVTLRDIQGTPSGDPFMLRQTVVPDEPPTVVITDPPGYIMATASSRVPIRGYAEDDLGVQRVECARTVTGFRDRLRAVGPNEPTRRFDWVRMLDLGKLGAEPGQTIEIYLEARDSNPNLLGVAASELVRIRVIADEEYAQILRNRADIEDFVSRYRAAHETLERLKEALRELERAYDTGERDAAALQRLMDAVRARSDEARAVFQRLADDFEIYDKDKNLAALARDVIEKLNQNDGTMAAQSAQAPAALRQAVAQCLENLQGEGGRMDEELRSAEEIAAIGKVMESAGEFQQLYLEQVELVRLLSRYRARTEVPDPALLAALGRRQADIRRRLAAWRDALSARAGELPEAYAELRASAEDFVANFDAVDILPPMDAAAQAGAEGRGHPAWAKADEALENMRALLSRCKGGAMGGMCEGALRFKVPDPLRQTLSQMLSAIGQRSGGGAGGVSGVGEAGAGSPGGPSSGYWMGGYSPVNTAVFGPGRATFAGGGGTGGYDLRGGGHAARGVAVPENTTREALGDAGATELGGDSRSRQQIPVRYRDVIKRYFSEEQ